MIVEFTRDASVCKADYFGIGDMPARDSWVTVKAGQWMRLPDWYRPFYVPAYARLVSLDVPDRPSGSPQDKREFADGDGLPPKPAPGTCGKQVRHPDGSSSPCAQRPGHADFCRSKDQLARKNAARKKRYDQRGR